MWSASAALLVLVGIVGFLSACIATLMMLFGPGIDRQNTRRGAPHIASHQEFLLTHVHAGSEESSLMERPRPNGQVVRLFYRFWLPKHLDSAKDARAVVVVLHGVNSHSARNNKFMVEVLQHGFLVAGMDHEGMGRSDGRHGYFSSVDMLVDDAMAFVDLVKAKYPGKKVFLLGAYVGVELNVVRLHGEADVFFFSYVLMMIGRWGTDDPARAEQGWAEAGGRRRHFVPSDGDSQGVAAVALDGSHRPTAAGVHAQAAAGEGEQWQEQLSGGGGGD